MSERSAHWGLAVAVTLLSGAAVSYGFLPAHAGGSTLLVVMAATYAPLCAAVLWWLRRRDLLKRRLIPQRGDITIGALIAVGLYLVTLVVHFPLTGMGKLGEAWLWRIYLQIGDAQTTANFAVGLAVMAIAAAEEVVWRGGVQSALLEVLPPRRAVVVTALLYALAHAPTIYLLRDPVVGPNPLLVTVALGCGLLWGFLAQRVDRIMPSVFAHSLFIWGVVEYPIWRM